MEINAIIDNITECKIIEFGDALVTVSVSNQKMKYPYNRISIPNIMVVMSKYLGDQDMMNNFKKYLQLKHSIV
jgi:hypothetical protein